MLPVAFSKSVFCTGNRLLCCTTHHVLLCCACIPTQRIMKAGLVVCDWHLAQQTRSIVQKKCSANLIPSNQHRKEVVISSRPRIEQGHISWKCGRTDRQGTCKPILYSPLHTNHGRMYGRPCENSHRSQDLGMYLAMELSSPRLSILMW